MGGWEYGGLCFGFNGNWHRENNLNGGDPSYMFANDPCEISRLLPPSLNWMKHIPLLEVAQHIGLLAKKCRPCTSPE